MNLRFYKKSNCWYADVPGHTEEENQMVDGADTFLDYISKGESEVTVNIQTTPSSHSRNAYATCFMLKHNFGGATYQIVSNDNAINGHTVWICNVTHDVLGEHPFYFFIHI